MYTNFTYTLFLKQIISVLIAISFVFPSLGQTASEYYQTAIDTSISSQYLKEKRNITVIVPKSFSKSKATKFPLIIVFDRQNKRIFRQIYESINYLVSFYEMPEAVIIGISTDDRKQFFQTSLKASTEKANEMHYII